MKSSHRSLLLASLSVGVALSACSSKSGDVAPSDSGPLDAPSDVKVDTAPADTAPPVPYPAFTPEMPRLQANRGVVMKSPIFVTITWPSEAAVDKLEAFGDQIGASDYWKAITAEYGVGPAKSGPENHVRMIGEPSPKTMTEGEAEAFVLKHVSDPTSKWPAPNDNILYVVYLPTVTHLTTPGGADACNSLAGYHSSARTDSGQRVRYAIIPACPIGGITSSDSFTVTASHEMAEAATDPDPGSGYVGFDNPHVAWELFQNGLGVEDGDACVEYDESTYDASPEFPYTVQRQWSNVAALAGKSPCAPSPPTPYFSATPLALDPIVIDLSAYGASRRFKTNGWTVAVGETKTFDVGLYSDGPTAKWTIDAVQKGNPWYPNVGGGDVTATVKTNAYGGNGDVATVSITVNTAGPGKWEMISIVSKNADDTIHHYMPIIIAN